MEPVHVKLEFFEAINSKRALLSCQMNILNSIDKMRNYKKLRKQELVQKVKLKAKLRQLKIEINSIHKTLPKIKPEPKPKIKQPKVRIIGKEKSRKLESELEDIKGRLKKLR